MSVLNPTHLMRSSTSAPPECLPDYASVGCIAFFAGGLQSSRAEGWTCSPILTLWRRIAAVLRERFEQIPDTEKLLRNWTKMAGLPAAVLLSQSTAVGHNELLAIIDDAAKQISGEVMPWDE